MIPQSAPLYLPDGSEAGIDLMLVVGWHPSPTRQQALPYVVFLSNSAGESPRIACVPASSGEMWHQELVYFTDCEQAEEAYGAALVDRGEAPA